MKKNGLNYFPPSSPLEPYWSHCFSNKVVDANRTCPSEYEEIFHAEWMGTRHFFVKNGQMADGQDRGKTFEEVQPIPALKMRIFNGKRICAKKIDSLNYLSIHQP